MKKKSDEEKRVGRLSRLISKKASTKKRKYTRQIKPQAEREGSLGDLEIHEIEPEVVKMADLCHDTGKGKVSTREKRLRQKDQEQFQRKQEEARRELREILSTSGASGAIFENVENPNNENDEDTETALNGVNTGTVENEEIAEYANGADDTRNGGDEEDEATDRNSEPSEDQGDGPFHHVPRVRLVDGVIVQDDDSRVVHRYNQATAGNGEEVQEDELTRRVNSGTYMKREKYQKWTEEMTLTLYEGIRVFGTDFAMISTLFPNRTRRQIKLKFTKEEKEDPAWIKQLLFKERKTITHEEFQEMTQTTLRDPKEVQQELDEQKRDIEDEFAKEEEARKEAERQREAEIAAEAEKASGKEDGEEKDAEEDEDEEEEEAEEEEGEDKEDVEEDDIEESIEN